METSLAQVIIRQHLLDVSHWWFRNINIWIILWTIVFYLRELLPRNFVNLNSSYFLSLALCKLGEFRETIFWGTLLPICSLRIYKLKRSFKSTSIFLDFMKPITNSKWEGWRWKHLWLSCIINQNSFWSNHLILLDSYRLSNNHNMKSIQQGTLQYNCSSLQVPQQ